MKALHTETAQFELVKWIAIVILAVALAALFLAITTANPGDRLQALPPEVETWAEPMPPEAALPEPVPMFPQQVEPPAAPDLLKINAWKAINHHRLGQVPDALQAWEKAPLPGELDLYRQVAMAAAWIEFGDLEKAAGALENARTFDANHPIIHYFTGLLRLEQAATALEWEDAVGPKKTMLVSYRAVPFDVVPNSRSMYRMIAGIELEAAINNADRVEMGLWLVPTFEPTAWERGMVLSPTVYDLLDALGAATFEGDAHHILAHLNLENGNADRAEHHLDQARELTVPIIFGYKDLGDLYTGQERFWDAGRAYLKAVETGHQDTLTCSKVVESWFQALHSLDWGRK